MIHPAARFAFLGRRLNSLLSYLSTPPPTPNCRPVAPLQHRRTVCACGVATRTTGWRRSVCVTLLFCAFLLHFPLAGDGARAASQSRFNGVLFSTPLPFLCSLSRSRCRSSLVRSAKGLATTTDATRFQRSWVPTARVVYINSLVGGWPSTTLSSLPPESHRATNRPRA